MPPLLANFSIDFHEGEKARDGAGAQIIAVENQPGRMKIAIREIFGSGARLNSTGCE